MLNLKHRLFLPCALALLLTAGCAGGGRTVLGSPPHGEARGTAAVRDAPPSSPVVVRGTLVEK